MTRSARLALLAAGAVLLAGCGAGGDGGRPDDEAGAPPPSAAATTSPDGAASPGSAASPGTAGALGDGVPAGEPPARVRIPAIGIDEDLVDLGTTATGELEVPSDPDRVGWFTEGGRPGGRGPTVVVGHLDSTTGPAVFADLPDLAPGDEVVVTTTSGAQVRYVVDRVEDVPQDTFPTAAVYGATADDQLRLITCTGPYDRAAGRYTENRVVWATAA